MNGKNGRLETLERQRKRVEKKIKGSTNGRTKFVPGEEERKKQLAVVLRLAGYSQEDIGASIGLSQPVVSRWLAEPEVKESYLYLQEHLTEGALLLLRTYTVEAIQTLVTVMREASRKGNFKAATVTACEILDRGGVPKSTRTDIEEHRIHTSDSRTDAVFIEALRTLSPEEQEEVAQLTERIDEVVKAGGVYSDVNSRWPGAPKAASFVR